MTAIANEGAVFHADEVFLADDAGELSFLRVGGVRQRDARHGDVVQVGRHTLELDESVDADPEPVEPSDAPVTDEGATIYVVVPPP